MPRALYAGSFDPFTNSHLAVVKKMAATFDQIQIVVAVNRDKKGMWTPKRRMEAITETLKAEDMRAEIASIEGELVAEYAISAQPPFSHLVRGLGTFSDYEFENQIYTINKRIAPDVETVFFMTGPAERDVRSSTVRELLANRRGYLRVRDMVPEPVFRLLMRDKIEHRLREMKRLNPGFENAVQDAHVKSVLARYEKRKYHNLQHIWRMMEQTEPSSLLNYAILWHDAVTPSDPGAPENDDACVKASADLALEHLRRLNDIDPALAGTVARLVLWTSGAKGDPMADCARDGSRLRELDWDILAETPDVYARYAEDIAGEFGEKYDADAYREGRRAFLLGVKNSEAYAEMPEKMRARIDANVAWELERL